MTLLTLSTYVESQSFTKFACSKWPSSTGDFRIFGRAAWMGPRCQEHFGLMLANSLRTKGLV